MENHFSEVKESFNSITIVVGYILKSPK